MYSPKIKKVIDIFTRFPTVGPRTAARFVFYLINLPNEDFQKVIESLTQLKKDIKICSFCFNPYEDKEGLCPICRDKTRDTSLLCLVEKEADLASIENSKKYKGLYFILGGTVSNLRKENLKKIRINELRERIKNPEKFGIKGNFKEIIIATDTTTEGEATALYIERKIKDLGVKTTRLGRGLPTGGELEYADEETLKSAFEGRK